MYFKRSSFQIKGRTVHASAETTEGMESSFAAHFERHIIPKAGHFVHQEQPDVLNELIVRFLNQSSADQVQHDQPL